ncbi:hypothetical protein ISCGN_029933 [Ixodes scapularis]
MIHGSSLTSSPAFAAAILEKPLTPPVGYRRKNIETLKYGECLRTRNTDELGESSKRVGVVVSSMAVDRATPGTCIAFSGCAVLARPPSSFYFFPRRRRDAGGGGAISEQVQSLARPEKTKPAVCVSRPRPPRVFLLIPARRGTQRADDSSSENLAAARVEAGRR